MCVFVSVQRMFHSLPDSQATTKTVPLPVTMETVLFHFFSPMYAASHFLSIHLVALSFFSIYCPPCLLFLVCLFISSCKPIVYALVHMHLYVLQASVY